MSRKMILTISAVVIVLILLFLTYLLFIMEPFKADEPQIVENGTTVSSGLYESGYDTVDEYAKDTDLSEDIENNLEDNSDYSELDEKTNSEIIDNEEDNMEKSTSLDDPELSFEDESENEEGLNLTVDDEDLEYESSKSGEVTYENEEENYETSLEQIDGGSQIKFILEDSSSPTEYKMDLDIPDDDNLMIDSEGQFYLENKDTKEVDYLIGSPTAIDSEGNIINTEYIYKDGSIYQEIYPDENTKYPVTADPLVCVNTIHNDRSEMIDKNTFKAQPTFCARSHGGARATSRKARAKKSHTKKGSLAYWKVYTRGMYTDSLGKRTWFEVSHDHDYNHGNKHKGKYYKGISNKYDERIHEQMLCHEFRYAGDAKPHWHLDKNRKDVSLAKTFETTCNPKITG